MSGYIPFLVELLQISLVVFCAPLLAGVTRTFKCWSQGRKAPGVLQPYRNLYKLFMKETVIADNASWIFRITPYIVFTTILLVGSITPIISTDLPLAGTADIIALIALYGLGRFFLALAGLDVGTSFGGMGSSREMMIASMAEPAMLMSTFTVSLYSQSTSLAEIVRLIGHHELLLIPSMVFALISFILILITETGRIPVDNPVTHLELTMIHEAMILEYSGRHLALLEWAGMMRMLTFSAIGIALFVPWGIPTAGDFSSIPLGIFILAVKLTVVSAGIVFIETGIAKMRIFRVPEFLGVAFLIATLGMLSHFMLEK